MHYVTHNSERILPITEFMNNVYTDIRVLELY